ncbi:MAG: CHASE3 domain-containing protein [Chitinophagaceae bacterium]|nr:CHASE3 domain-containing protein [Chitinophagaceae bacterium]
MRGILKRAKGDKRFRQGYGVAFFLLLFAYFSTFYANRQLLNQSGKVEHSNKVIANLEIMLSELKDAETYVRGYVITKQPEFLSPYYGSGEKADSLFNVVLQLTIDNAEQQERLTQLKKDIDERFALFLASIKIFDDNNRQISDSLAQLQLKSEMVTDKIRKAVTILQNYENRLLLLRDERMKKTFDTITAITLISVAIAFLLIIFAFITYKREHAARKGTAKEIEDYQQQLKKRIDELSKANTELIQVRSHEKFAATGRIARTIAHEVRNPLTNINLAADQLKEEVGPNDENATHLFEMINRNSSRINQLISDLLNSTKFSELTVTKISVNDLLDETLKEANDRISLNHINVIKKYTSGSCDVSVDKDRIKIALLNIIINAVEAMGNREGSALTLETKAEHNKCRIIINDNGPGLDKEALTRLFEPYFTSKPKGNGLGLTITQNIILNHKGEISVESTKGEGVNFTITLDCSL